QRISLRPIFIRRDRRLAVIIPFPRLRPPRRPRSPPPLLLPLPLLLRFRLGVVRQQPAAGRREPQRGTVSMTPLAEIVTPHRVAAGYRGTVSCDRSRCASPPYVIEGRS